MAEIKITLGEDKNFSVFKTTRNIVEKLKDSAGDKTDFVLENFSEHQASAIIGILSSAILKSINLPVLSGTESVSAPIQNDPELKKGSVSLGKIGNIEMTYNEKAKLHTISFPNVEGTLPAYQIEQYINFFQKSVLESNPFSVKANGIDYCAFPYKDRENAEFGMSIISEIAHAHGFTQYEDVASVMRGIDLGQQGVRPCILLREEAYNVIKQKERNDVPPLPGH